VSSPTPEASTLATVFPAVAPSASAARRFVKAALRRLGVVDEVVVAATLLTSELVTNSFRHAGNDAEVSVHRTDGTVRVEVRDGGGGEPRLQAVDVTATDGRGLQIVDALARRWGTHTSRGATVVWFEVDAR
jgi:anti-sigma regulatory factor (Ser/Thr protein kinase)